MGELVFCSGTFNGNRQLDAHLDPDFYNANSSREAPRAMAEVNRKAIMKSVKDGCPTFGWVYIIAEDRVRCQRERGRARRRSASPPARRRPRSRSQSHDRSPSPTRRHTNYSPVSSSSSLNQTVPPNRTRNILAAVAIVLGFGLAVLIGFLKR